MRKIYAPLSLSNTDENKPGFEVADIFRLYGPLVSPDTFHISRAGQGYAPHLSVPHCRTGRSRPGMQRVRLCTKQLQLLPGSALPEMSDLDQGKVAGRTEVRTAALRLFP